MTQDSKPAGQFQPVAPGLFLRGADHAHMEIDGRVLLMALLLSLVAHALILWTVYGRSLGSVDASLLRPPGEVVRVQRAFEDRIIDADGPGAPSAKPDRTEIKPPAPSDLVRETLSNTSAGPAMPGTSPKVLATPTVGPRTTEAGPHDPGAAGGLRDPSQLGGAGNPASPAGLATGAGGDAGPRVELPAALAKPPSLSKGVELAYSGSTTGNPALSVPGGAMVAGDGRGKTVAGDGSGGSGIARNLLADQSTTPGVSLGPPPLEPYRPTDKTGPGIPATRPTPPAPPRPAVVLPPTAKLPHNNLQPTEHLDDDFDYALTVLDPANPQRGYLRVDITPRRTLQRLHTMPKDVVFLVDTSLSIPQEWVDNVVAGIRDSLATLNPEDRFNIVLFNQTARFFKAEGVAPATDANIAAAQEFLAHARAAGMTDVNQALTRLLVRDVGAERVYDLVLISDGKPTLGVMDTRDLINLITRDNDLAASIYCVGVAEDPNHQLLEFLAYRNKGFCVYAGSEKKAAVVIRDLMGRLRYPIIKDVHADVAGIDPAEVYPRDLPNIHQGQMFSIFGRWDTADRFTMRISGKNGSRPVDVTFTRDLAQGAKGEKKMATEWAFWKLHWLYSQLISVGNTPAIRAQIEAIRKEYGLKTVY
ncbi:MAG: VWA domain-containing protein [Planctomycetota bacterium]|nr:VWA domain-containing protein [Planctomycetota bacterium]